MHDCPGLSSRACPSFGVASLLAYAAIACNVPGRQLGPGAYPNAGLYTPDSMLGTSDPSDVPMQSAGLGNRCVPLAPADAGTTSTTTPGTLHVDYTTQTQHGRYQPKNCTAVWIETLEGQYVATLEIGAALRRAGLVYFQDHACIEKRGPDVVTTATLPDHAKPHVAMWSGVDFEGNPVADRSYRLFIEVTESDKEPGDIGVFDFDKGAAPSSVEEPVAFDGPLMHVSVAWTPMAGGRPGGAAGAN